MSNKILALILCLCLTLALAACGSKDEAETETTTTKTTATTAESTTEEDEELFEDSDTFTDAKALEESLGTLLQDCTGWGEGKAGWSLDSAACAVHLVTWAEDHNASELSEDTLRTAVADWVSSADADAAAQLAENWTSLAENGDALFADFASVEGTFDDAGVLDEAKEDAAKDGGQADWEALKLAIEMSL